MSSENIKTDISTDIRKPGIYSEYDTTNAVAGLPSAGKRVAVLAQFLAAGTGVAEVPDRAFSEADAITKSGTGSIMHLAVRAIFKANPDVKLDMVPIEDAGGSTAATATITLANAATASGTLDLWIGNEFVQISITNGDAVNDIATLLDAAINAKEHNMPVTASVSAPVITLTARNKGLLGNNVPVSYRLNNVTGTTVTVVQTGSVVTGAGDPSIANALAAIAPEKYDFVFNTLNDATNLGLLKDHLNTVSNATEGKPGVGVFGYTGVQATIETLAGTTLNAERLNVGYLKYSKTTERGHSLDYEVGAAYAGILASHDDPALPYNNEELIGIAPSATEQRLTRAQQESTLENGVTPLEIGAGESVRVVRAITTYTTNAAGTLDIALLDIMTIRSLDFGRFAIEQRQGLRFSQAKATSRTRAKVQSEVFDVIENGLAPAEIWKPVSIEEIIVEPDSDVPGRFNTSIPAHVVQGLHILTNKINLFLT